MAKYTLGFIGVGNMGGAVATAACNKFPGDVIISNRTMSRAESLARDLGCAFGTYEEVAESSEFVVVGTLPGAVEEVVRRVYPAMKKSGAALVSMASGVTIADLHSFTDPEFPVIRIMPNTPVAVGQGLVLYAADEKTPADMLSRLCALLSCAGAMEPLDESLFTAGSTVAGCGPAFAALFIEALSDGGVKAGLPRAQAIRFAEQMLLGAAALALKTGRHPGQLKDEVCSPGGSTIEGVQALEEGGFRAAVMRAVVAAWEKHR
jgi:pyrroline-5-carboxylate reductase